MKPFIVLAGLAVLSSLQSRLVFGQPQTIPDARVSRHQAASSDSTLDTGREASATVGRDCLIFDTRPHCQLGDSRLTVLGETLVVSRIGPSGRDGVAIRLGEVGGLFWTSHMPPSDQIPIGARLVTRSRGQVDGVPNQLTATVQTRRLLAGFELTPDFSPIGADTYEIQLYLEDRLVFSRNGLTGPAAVLRDPDNVSACCCRGLEYSWTFSKPLIVDLFNGREILADTVIFLADDPDRRIDFLSSFALTAANLPAFGLSEEVVEPPLQP